MSDAMRYDYPEWMSDERVRAAVDLAVEAHGKQVRKYTGVPYFVHPVAVAELVGSVLSGDELYARDAPVVVAAALLHDVLEDTSVTEDELRARFGDMVTDIVVELTDVYVPGPGPGLGLNRRERKRLERERLARVSTYAQSVKVADLIDNTPSIVAHDPDFAPTYVAEKQALLEVLTRAHPALLAEARRMMEEVTRR